MPILLGKPSACYTTWTECILLKDKEVVSPREVMVFHFDSGWAGGAGRDGSGKLVLLSSLLAVRRLWAGTPRSIQLGQQLPSREQTQVLTGCSPAQSYQQLPLSLSASDNPSLLPLGCLCQNHPWGCFSEEGTEQEHRGSPGRTLGVQETLWNPTGDFSRTDSWPVGLSVPDLPCIPCSSLLTASTALCHLLGNQAPSLRLGSIIFAPAPD